MIMKKLIIILSIGITSVTAFTQVGDLGDFLKGGTESAEKLISGYLSPWTNALGTSLSGGWYNTAESHKTLGFDLTLTTSMSFVPETDKTFDLTTLNLEGANFPDGSISPTVAGNNTTGAAIELFEDPLTPNNYLIEFNAPPGTDVGFMASPMIQLGVGIIKDTEITGRYLPTINLGDFGSLGLWGVGVKHGIKQWIPVVSKIPVLQLAVQAGYTEFSSNFKVNADLTPTQLGFENRADNNNYTNQDIDLDISSFTGNLLVGASLPIIHFYGGVGFTSTNSVLAFNGNIPIPTGEVNNDGSIPYETQDGFEVDMNNSDGKIKPRANIGFRIKLGVLTIHADYTAANYNVATAGLGISFR